MSKRTDKKSKLKPGARPLEGDDLFRTVMETTTPLDSATRRRFVDVDPFLDGTSGAAPAGKPVKSQKQSPIYRRPDLPAPAVAPLPQDGFDRGTLRQVKQGKIEIDGKLDLHGMTQAQAHLRLIKFIENAARSGKRCVLVITGKGAPEGAQQQHGFLEGSTRGVLRRMTPIWLSARNLAPWVVDFQSALPRDGGDGALYVRLRRLK